MIISNDESTQRERDEQKRSSGTRRSSRKSTQPGPDKNPDKNSGRRNRPKPHEAGVPR